MNVEHILARKGREVRTIRPNVSIAEALRRLRAEGIGSLVVSENGTNLVGIVSDRDILNAIADHGIDILSLPRPRGHPVKVHHAAPAICSWAWAGVKKPRPECRRRRL